MNRQFISFVNLASRFYSPASTTGGTLASIGTAGMGGSIGRTRMALEGFADERRRRVLTVGESPSDRREYVRLHMDSDLLGLDGHGNALQTPSRKPGIPKRWANLVSSINTMRILNDLPPISHSHNYGMGNRQSRAKANYYYRLKLLPKPLSFGEGLKVKVGLPITSFFLLVGSLVCNCALRPEQFHIFFAVRHLFGSDGDLSCLFNNFPRNLCRFFVAHASFCHRRIPGMTLPRNSNLPVLIAEKRTTRCCFPRSRVQLACGIQPSYLFLRLWCNLVIVGPLGRIVGQR